MSPEPPQDHPLSLPCLSFAGQLLVWSGRQWVGRAGDWQIVEAEFSGPLGSSVGQALAGALHDLYTLLNVAALRPVIFGPPNCRRVWRDEALIVQLVWAEQQHRSAWTVELLEQLLPPAAARQAVAVVASIAHLLARAGYEVAVAHADPMETPPAPYPGQESGKVTIH